eukprot:644273-Alexandrium_andersonii.AAC.1
MLGQATRGLAQEATPSSIEPFRIAMSWAWSREVRRPCHRSGVRTTAMVLGVVTVSSCNASTHA